MAKILQLSASKNITKNFLLIEIKFWMKTKLNEKM